MPTRSKSKKPGGKKAKTATGSKVSRSERAQLVFPVGRVHRHLKEGRYAKRIGALAPVFLAAVMEFMTQEVLELAAEKTVDVVKKKRINPRAIQLGVLSDGELKLWLSDATIAGGGVAPFQKASVESE